jgi:hypothetical protein
MDAEKGMRRKRICWVESVSKLFQLIGAVL